MRLIETHLSAIAGKAPNANMQSIIPALTQAAVGTGLNRPHRLAHFLAQIAHESGGFHYDREVWGPSAAQKRYEGRADLGNTQPGDGSRFRGRGPIQLTGRSNYRQFTSWARRMVPGAPDFEATPDAINTDPWEGMSAVWFWDSRGLNALADANDLRGVTRKINGGYNGLADRERYYDRAALVLLGYSASEVRRFQQAAGIPSDGVSGPQTRAALHRSLQMAPLVEFGAATARAAAPPVKPPTDLDTTVVRPVARWAVVILFAALAAYFILGG